MSRLTENDIALVAENLRLNDALWKERLGFTLEDAARMAVGISGRIPPLKTAVAPITGGLGLIGGFSETVCAILSYCGADAFVSAAPDAGGVQEAYRRGAELVFMADDEVFTAFSTRNGVFSDNSWATGRGFAAALCLMMTQRGENPEDAEVLVLGAGPVGSAAAAYFSHRGIPAALADLDEAKARQAAEKLPGVKAVKKPACLRSYPYLLDATPAAAFITEGDVTEKTLISAPGMPLGVSGEALKTALVFHNPLELGVMTMYYECASKFHT